MGSNVMNAPIPAEHGDRTIASGSAGRDAGQKAGVASGLSEKSTFSNTGVQQLGKPMAPMGTPAWDKTKVESMGPTVGSGDFGSGKSHSFKNG